MRRRDPSLVRWPGALALLSLAGLAPGCAFAGAHEEQGTTESAASPIGCAEDDESHDGFSDDDRPERAHRLRWMSDETAFTFSPDPHVLRPHDVDWFVFQARDATSNPTRSLVPNVTIDQSRFAGRRARVCAFTTRSVQCEIGEAETYGAMRGCCSTKMVQLDIERPFVDDTTDIFVRVDGVSDACVRYGVTHGLRP